MWNKGDRVVVVYEPHRLKGLAGFIFSPKNEGPKHGLIEIQYDNPAIKNSSGWSEDDSLMSEKEYERIHNMAYHCTYCGKEGHNRRTCPEIKSKVHAEDGLVFKPFSEIKSELKEGDLFKVSHTSIQEYTDKFIVGTFKVTEVRDDAVSSVVETIPHASYSKGDKCHFSSNTWNFALLTEESLTVKLKALTVWELVEAVLPVSRLTLLYGPPGTGKTTAANFHGSPAKVCNITLTEETPAAELRGHFVPRGGEFKWMDGPAVTAFKKGYRLVLNEIDKASGDALTFCHALLDDPGIARITLPYEDEYGEPVTILPHDDFHVIATMNGEPDDLPEALRDRFAVRIFVNKVHPEAIKSLPKDLHNNAKKGVSKDGTRSVSIRGWNAFHHLRELIGEEAAAVAVFQDSAETILNTLRISKVGGSPKV